MASPAVVKNTCKRLVKNDRLEKVPCGRLLKQGICGNENVHISKYKTGFCAKGWCEGKNPKTFSGAPAPTCRSWKTCGCSCHDMLDMLYASTGQPREVVNSSDYKPDTGAFKMPTPEERVALHAASNGATGNHPTLVESPLPEAVPATVRRTYTPTATGRAARGELESWVKEQCDIWIVEAEEFPCTPAYLSEEIGRVQGIKPPSVGAISAVFERWVKMGFANIEKKPTRFVSYTADGIRLGLDGCKDKAKRAKAAAARASAHTLQRR